RTSELSPQMHEAVLIELSDNGIRAEEKRFDSIGPILGREALQKSWISVVIVLMAIVLFITFAFRHVSEPVSSWKYALIAIIALIHDVIIPSGAFALLGYFAGFEIDTLFVTALLVILGFSIHDTIVVFDRVRENLKNNTEGKQKKSFETIVGESINQTFVRSVNTSLTTLIAIFVLYLIGADATRHFALTLIIGITVGTYSSIFLGSPLLVTVYNWQQKNKNL
ncbi:MAG: protein translocase subunit SecF, partial [Patescibacteria group bacterium]